MIDIAAYEQSLVNNWLNDGTITSMTRSNLAYQNSNKMGARAPQLLKQALAIGIEPDKVKDSKQTPKVMALVSAYKMANYLANAAYESESSGDPSILESANSKVGEAIGNLSSYNENNKDNFSKSLQELAGFNKDLEYTTFGTQTDYDKGLKAETSMLSRVLNTTGDMSLVAAGKRSVESFESRLDRDIENELLRTGVIDEGYIEKGLGLVGGLTAGILEAKFLSSAGAKASHGFLKKDVLKAADKISTITRAEDIGSTTARYLGQGAVLSVAQSLQDQSGLIEKYDDGSGMMKLLGDAIQNVSSMYIGDKVVAPLLKAHSLRAIKKLSGTNIDSVDDVIKKAASENKNIIEAVENSVNVKDIPGLSDYLKDATKGSRQVLSDNLGKIYKDAVFATLSKQSWKPLSYFAGEMGADLAFDYMTTSMLDAVNLSTVHQSSMYSLKELTDSPDWKSAIYNTLSQRLFMKAGGQVLSKMQEVYANKTHGEGEKGIGTPEWIVKHTGRDSFSLAETTMMRINNFLTGNDFKDLDSFIRQRSNELNLNDYMSQGGKQFEALISSYLFTSNANNKLALALGKSILPDMFPENMKDIADVFDKTQAMSYNAKYMMDEFASQFSSVANTSSVEINSNKDIDKLSDILSKDIVSKLNVFKAADSADNISKFHLDKEELQDGLKTFVTALKGFNIGSREQTDFFINSFLEKTKNELIAKAYIADQADFNSKRPGDVYSSRGINLGNIDGAMLFARDQIGLVSITAKDFEQKHDSILNLLKRSNFNVSNRFDETSQKNFYAWLTTFKSDFLNNEKFKQTMENFDKVSNVLPKNIALDFDNIKAMEKIVLDGVSKGEFGDMIKTKSDLNNVAKQALKQYSESIYNIKRKSLSGQKPSLADSNQVTAYVMKFLNLAQRVSLDLDGQVLAQRLSSDSWIQESIAKAMTKSGKIGQITGSKELDEKLATGNGFADVVKEIVNLSNKVGIGKRYFASQFWNSKNIESVLSAANIGDTDIDTRRVYNYLVDFAQSLPSESGLAEFTVGKNVLGNSWATKARSVFEQVTNNKIDNLSDEDLSSVYGIALAKYNIRNMYANGLKLEDLPKEIKASIVNGKAIFQIDHNETDREKMRLFIANNFAGVINKVVDLEQTMASANSRFTFASYRNLDTKEILDKMKFLTLSDYDIEEAAFNIVKGSINLDDAKLKLKKLFGSIDNSLSGMNELNNEGKSFNIFVNQLAKKYSAMNAFHITASLDKMNNKYLKDMSITFSNQNSYLDLIDGMKVININFDESFVQKAGTEYGKKAYQEVLNSLAKRGIHEVTKKGNTMESMFVHIPDTDKNGNINNDVLRDALITRLKRTMAESTDAVKQDNIAKLINDIAISKGKEEKLQDLSRNFFKKYVDIMQSQFSSFKTKGKNLQDTSGKGELEIKTFEDIDFDGAIAKTLKQYGMLVENVSKSMDNLQNRLSNSKLIDYSAQEALLRQELNLYNSSIPKVNVARVAKKIIKAFEHNNKFLGEVKGDAAKTISSGVESSAKKTKAYLEVLNGLADSEHKSELLKYVMFGDSYIAEEGHITKRSSYANTSLFLNADGSWANEKYKEFFENMANNVPVYFALLNGDGDCYMPSHILDVFSTNEVQSQGKLVSDTALFGGMKLNFHNSERLHDVLIESGIDESKAGVLVDDKIKNSIVIDVTAYKTMLPEVLNSLSTDSSGRVFLRSTLPVKNMAMFLANMTLHSPIETGARQKGEFGFYVDTPMSGANRMVSNSHLDRIVDDLKPEKELSLDDYMDTGRTFGAARNRMHKVSMAVSGMSKVEPIKQKTMQDAEVLTKEDLDQLYKHMPEQEYVLPKVRVSANMLASLIENSVSLIDSKDKKHIREISKMYANISDNKSESNHKFIDRYRRSGNSEEMLGEWVDGKGFVIANKNNKAVDYSELGDVYKDINGDIINVKYSFDNNGKLLSKDVAYNKLLSDIAKEAMKMLSTGNRAPIQKYDIGDEKSVFMLNITRYPNQRMGQNFFAVIEGINSKTYGLEVSDHFYRKILGGDYDGDAVQIIGLSTKNVMNGISMVKEIKLDKNKESNNITALKILNESYANAVIALDSNRPVAFEQSKFEGVWTQPGVFAASLNDMQLYDSMFLSLGKSAQDVFHTEARMAYNDTIKDIYKDSDTSEHRIQISELKDFTYSEDDGRSATFFQSTNAYKNVEMKFSLRDMVSSDSEITAGGIKFSLRLAKDGDSNEVAVLIRNADNDFPAGKVMAAFTLPDDLQALAELNTSGLNDIELRKQIANKVLKDEEKHLQAYYEESKDMNSDKYYDSMFKIDRNRLRVPDNVFMVTKQMLTEAGFNIGVDNMKNNTLVYMLNAMANSGSPNGLKDLIAKVTVGINIKSFVKKSSDGAFFETGKPQWTDNVVRKRPMLDDRLFDSVVNSIRSKIDSGSVPGYEWLSRTNFDNIKGLFTSVPDADKFMDAMKALLPGYKEGVMTENRNKLAKLPMFYQAAIVKYASYLNGSFAGAGNTMKEIIGRMDTSIKSKTDDNLNAFFSSRTLSEYDIMSEEDKLKLSEEEKLVKQKSFDKGIRNPVAFVYNFVSAEKLLRQYNYDSVSDEDIKKNFSIISNTSAWIKLPGKTDLQAVYSTVAKKINESTGRSVDGSQIESMLRKNGLAFSDNTKGMIALDEIIKSIRNYTGEISKDELVKKISESINSSKNKTLSGFNIKKNGKTLTIEQAVLELKDIVNKANKNNTDPDRSELSVGITKALISMLDVDQQRFAGLVANGINSKSINLIGKEEFDAYDIKQMYDTQRDFRLLKSMDLFEQAEIVRDDMITMKARSLCE